MRHAIFIRYRKIYDGWTKRNRESKKNFEKFMIDITHFHCVRRILSSRKKKKRKKIIYAQNMQN